MQFWLPRDESKRIGHIAHVLFQNGLGYYLAKLNLRKKLPFIKRIKTDHFKEKELTPQILLKVFEDLGGSFVKLGQLLSLRPDLIPGNYCDELSKLQDKVRPFAGQEAVSIIEKELGKPLEKIFLEFDHTPVAAASMGQVHIAKLKDGKKVAVKVQRPGIERTVKIDIKLLYRIASMIKKRYGSKILDPVDIVREFERYTENELNYLKEAHHIDLFYKNFERSQTIIIPKVFWNYTTSKVLTMEYIPGKALTDMLKLTPSHKKAIIRDILMSEFEQIFSHGIFHADPHPGNFIIKKNGKIAMVDFGIIGRMDYVLKDNMTDLFISLVNADVDGVTNSAVRLGVASEDVDIQAVRRDLYGHLSEYYGASIDKIKISQALSDLITLFRKNNLRVLPNFVLLSKAMVTLEGMASRLDPKFDFVEFSRPYVKKLVRQRMDPRKAVDRARKKIGVLMQFAESIPRKTTTMLAELHDTDRDLRRIDRDISTLAVEMNRSSNRLTLGFLSGTLFIASTVLLPFQTVKVFGIPLLSFIGFMIALIVLIAIVVSMLGEKSNTSLQNSQQYER